ncbi:hypothetical protein GLOIN_2v1665426 [Rhizophagus irregularis DAOM 181602=DAOM 197198]|uniref:Uncharacterized protein n=1 Tax=Rhizophagus irregularis (strain DAOM 181602 / DAOM 197198 / MUCL 43194) TaxID=747089 RepID=U9TTT6_RHIID|nr:hypothetical protein GLOIN_2v1665426 [Rhizophagus irregularis DAOM 181602=DAOM 197198]POG65541.1 hypothetical protein GLOIN_2v1665426 [Rhizophagus irregularis DAOM 181602=DAOM 197198]|eukprot:XP_025172407.1 hypothetical protein GLOIN_2v1665426 [Rhizophagus irregularis DAOM 181602=DAOM 197198]
MFASLEIVPVVLCLRSLTFSELATSFLLLLVSDCSSLNQELSLTSVVIVFEGFNKFKMLLLFCTVSDEGEVFEDLFSELGNSVICDCLSVAMLIVLFSTIVKKPP